MFTAVIFDRLFPGLDREMHRICSCDCGDSRYRHCPPLSHVNAHLKVIWCYWPILRHWLRSELSQSMAALHCPGMKPCWPSTSTAAQILMGQVMRAELSSSRPWVELGSFALRLYLFSASKRKRLWYDFTVLIETWILKSCARSSYWILWIASLDQCSGFCWYHWIVMRIPSSNFTSCFQPRLSSASVITE